VTIWYTAPTAIRRLMRTGIEPRRLYDLSRLRVIHSVGEPLNPEAVIWGEQAMGLADPRQLVADGNRRHHDRQLPGRGDPARVHGAAAARGRGGRRASPGPDQVEVVTKPGPRGTGSQTRCPPCFVATCTMRNATASFCRRLVPDRRPGPARRRRLLLVRGRADDIIKTSGHMVGPFEVESALMEHPAVAEAGVIGKPEPDDRELSRLLFPSKRVRPGDKLRWN